MARWLMVVPPVLFAGLAGLFYAGMYRDNPGELQSVFVGHPAPVLPTTKLPGIPGLSDADLTTGKVTVVNFWATWCPPCVQELPLLSRFYTQVKHNGWQMLGLAIDQTDLVQRFLARAPVSFPVAMAGPSGVELTRKLGNAAGGLPFTVIFDRTGQVQHRKLGQLKEADLIAWLR